MSDRRRKTPSSPFTVWAVCLFVMGVMYLASLGPVCWLYGRGMIGDAAFDRTYATVYFPICWMDEHTNFFEDNPAGWVYGHFLDWFIP